MSGTEGPPTFKTKSEELEFYKNRVKETKSFTPTMDLYVSLVLYGKASELHGTKAAEYLSNMIERLEDVLVQICVNRCENAVLAKRVYTELLVDEMVSDRNDTIGTD